MPAYQPHFRTMSLNVNPHGHRATTRRNREAATVPFVPSSDTAAFLSGDRSNPKAGRFHGRVKGFPHTGNSMEPNAPLGLSFCAEHSSPDGCPCFRLTLNSLPDCPLDWSIKTPELDEMSLEFEGMPAVSTPAEDCKTAFVRPVKVEPKPFLNDVDHEFTDLGSETDSFVDPDFLDSVMLAVLKQ